MGHKPAARYKAFVITFCKCTHIDTTLWYKTENQIGSVSYSKIFKDKARPHEIKRF